MAVAPSPDSATLGDWTLFTRKSHILPCTCKCQVVYIKCNYCVYNAQLTIPDRPEMTFDKNILTLTHDKSGCKIELNALDALKMVNDKQDVIKVAYSKEWLSKRQGNENIKNVPKPFDWTFSTEYIGTLMNTEQCKWVAEDTELNFDKEKLMRRDKILYHDEFILFEDELADNGSTKLLVKCRVMPTFILVLLRFYLRVDNVMIKVQETRFYCEKEWDYILRDVTLREVGYSQVEHLPNPVLFDEFQINQYLPITKQSKSKLFVVPVVNAE